MVNSLPLHLGGLLRLGYHFGGPHKKDYSILGSILGYPNFGKLPFKGLGFRYAYQEVPMPAVTSRCVTPDFTVSDWQAVMGVCTMSKLVLKLCEFLFVEELYKRGPR